MSTDMNLSLRFRGTDKEITEMIHVLQYYETDRSKQYFRKHNCNFIDCVVLKSKSESVRLDSIKAKKLSVFIHKSNATIDVEASGPYGAGELADPEIFMAISEAAPEAVFSGEIDGFEAEEQSNIEAELKDARLTLSKCTFSTCFEYELYREYVDKILPCESFCKLFHMQPADFEEEMRLNYYDFMAEIQYLSCSHPEFMEKSNGRCSLTYEEYDSACAEARNLGFLDPDMYTSKYINMDDFTFRAVYDPIHQKYIAGQCDEFPLLHRDTEPEEDPLENLYFAAAGRMGHWRSQDEIKRFVSYYGGYFQKEVSSKTNYLLCNDSGACSAKLKKAVEMDIPVLSEEEFFKKFFGKDTTLCGSC